MPRSSLKAACAALALGLAEAPAVAQERGEIPDFQTFGEAASRADADAVNALAEDFRAAWGAEDSGALAALHAMDVEWMNAFGRIVRGREALRDFFAIRMFPGFSPAVSREEADALQILSIRYLGSDAAVLHMYAEGRRNESRNEGEAMRRSHLHFTLEKQDGVWRIAHAAIMDPRR